MKILRMEPTPSPNVMKLTVDVKLNNGVRVNVSKADAARAPQHIQRLLAIDDVTGVFQTADFIALERDPKGDWAAILQAVQGVLDVAEDVRQMGVPTVTVVAESAFGEVAVRVQMFRGIPMQVRVSAGLEEKRDALPPRFIEAAMQAGLHVPNLIYERKLEEYGVRYGSLDEVLATVIAEIEATFDDTTLQRMAAEPAVAQAETTPAVPAPPSVAEWQSAGWEARYGALQRLNPEEANLPLFLHALKDEHVSIRRYAVVQLGQMDAEAAMLGVLDALYDPSPIVRRTAGDACSDKGDPMALPHMVRLLQDRNKLVRWRAARFLYECGGEAELEALRDALDEEEFEIRLQIELAIERIAHGGEAEGTVWQQMTRRNH
jgi:hypothetical protein